MSKKKKDENKDLESGLEELEENATGDRFLPGTAPIVVKAIVNSVKKIEQTLKPEFGRARDALVAEQNHLSDLAHKNIAHFSEPDGNGTRTYEAGGVVVKITFEKEKIVTKIKDDE